MKAKELAKKFHESYERLATEFNYKTRKASAVAWDDVPENNKALMIAVCRELNFIEKSAADKLAGALSFMLKNYGSKITAGAAEILAEYKGRK